MASVTTLATLLAAGAGAAFALDNGFGRTPVMGYSTYNDVGCTPNETYLGKTMQSFADRGFPALGYKYFQLDCGWQGFDRSSNGSITYDASVFPNGIAPLSKKANSLGMHWSMYTDQGKYSCDTRPSSDGLRPGSLGHEKQDAQQLAQWNVSYMKVDNCYVNNSDKNAPKSAQVDFVSRFGAWSEAQQDVGIKGLLICQWGAPYINSTGLQGPAEWTPSIANSFRVADDITAGWDSVMRILNEDINVNLRGLNGPGHFADLDLLEVGNNGMTDAEQASHFAVWAMFKSALLISTAVPTMSERTAEILSNKDLIAINQDSLGKPAVLVQRFSNDYDVYAGPLANGDRAVLLLDQTNTNRTLSLNFSLLGIDTATVKDLWTNKTTADVNSYSAEVSAHGSLPLRLSQIKTLNTTDPKLTWIEAESGTLSGGAKTHSCSGCSGSSKVGEITNSGGSLTLSGIKTSQATQDVRFDYLNCEVGYLWDPDTNKGGGWNVRGASISVNGGSGQSVLFPLSGYNWDKDVTKNHLVRLSGFNTSGTNTIEITGLSGSTDYAPDFDRIGFVA